MKVGNIQQNVTHSPKRFTKINSVLAKQGFRAGSFYYEVQVGRKKKWTIGVVRESINRSGSLTKDPAHGVWAIWLKDGKYCTHGETTVLSERPEKVGVFVNYESRLVSFYDADRWNRLWSLRGVPFKEKLYPYFYTGFDSSPVIISNPALCKK